MGGHILPLQMEVGMLGSAVEVEDPFAESGEDEKPKL
jgi:hypothetical protein